MMLVSPRFRFNKFLQFERGLLNWGSFGVNFVFGVQVQ